MTRKAAATSFPLFVPATRPDRIAKACAAGTDTVVIDLEDAVAPTDKTQAADGLRAVELPPGDTALFLRINGVGTPWFAKDIEIAGRVGIDGIVLPKAEYPDQIIQIRNAVPQGMAIFALIETARGLNNATSIAAACDRLVFGSIDYSADIGCAHTPTALLHARSTLVVASRLAGLPGPIDGVTTGIDRPDLIRDDAAHGNELGFRGKLLIHPKQLASAIEGYRPDEDTLAWAHRILAAASGGDAVAVDGEMVDKPVIDRARSILDLNESLNAKAAL
ncbi:CoA ester lyase [Rhodospirillaceae bacterium KN72]|uniref:CoA ester lyase n=1 Tax=Pacificispira spongiicola TaxID=2729598 RepID=A0A7Y0HFP4_9PROT|nr:CoA ester lyase [Pacificispira spongiicola]NMM46071.1 CoA ester lyase [Pacificispira spongiicola]